MVRVIVREAGGDYTIKHDRVGDHNAKWFRDWIGKTAYWAARSGHTVYMAPESE